MTDTSIPAAYVSADAEAFEELNRLEQVHDDAGWEQARIVAALAETHTQREIADGWFRRNGKQYSQTHVNFVLRAHREFDYLGNQDRPSWNEAYHSPEVRKSDAHVANNSGENEWYTPQSYIDAARAVMGGIDLDPASSAIANKTVQAATFHTAETNGLEKPWNGRIWLNPPYAQPLVAQFINKLADELADGHTEQAIVLTNNATETRWWQTLTEDANAICFLHGRVKFLDPAGQPGAPLQGQTIVYHGTHTDRFQDEYGDMGVVR